MIQRVKNFQQKGSTFYRVPIGTISYTIFENFSLSWTRKPYEHIRMRHGVDESNMAENIIVGRVVVASLCRYNKRQKTKINPARQTVGSQGAVVSRVQGWLVGTTKPEAFQIPWVIALASRASGCPKPSKITS